jgi:CO/xanthine dehydrogenase FAD-binding subunit
MDELWHLLDEEPQARVYAGGTDLLVRMSAGQVQPPALLCLERLQEIRGVCDLGDHMWIGAATTHTQLIRSPLVREHAPILAHAVRVLGSPPIRNMGTIGGNIVNASPAGDTLPPLYVLEAEVEIRSKKAQRQAPIRDFIQGPGKVTLDRREIVSGVKIRKQPHYNVHHYEKVGRRKALACSVAGMAALIGLSSSNTIEAIRLAWGSVGPTVVTIPGVEAALVGRPLSVQSLKDMVPVVSRSVSPIGDVRASASYRREVSGRLILRLAYYAR